MSILRWLVASVSWLLTGATARWLGDAPNTNQCVYFANHASHLDFVVLWSALPADVRARTRPVAGADYWRKSWLRRFLAENVFRAVLIERRAAGEATREEILAAAKAAVEKTAQALDDGSSLILFPEGTRGPGGEPLPFKPGLYHLCTLRPGLELVPVWLDHLGRVLPKGEVMPVPLLATATLGLPMRLEDGESRDAFLARAREALLALWPDRARHASPHAAPEAKA
jgi:1-acyl-sn-glycerol-3-phosphate acyltransferase